MNDVCCPAFDSTPWDNKILTWHNKRFIKTKIKTFFYMPIGYGNAMTKLQTLADKYNAKIEYLCLSKNTSMWNIEVFLEVDKEIPNIEKISIIKKDIRNMHCNIIKNKNIRWFDG